MMYTLAQERSVDFMDYKENFICLIIMAVILFQINFYQNKANYENIFQKFSL